VTFNIQSDNTQPLTCDAFENRVQQVLDDRLTLTGDARLMEHASLCSDCETKLLDYDSFDDSISFLKQSSVDVPRVDDEASDHRLFRPVAGLAFLAATLLFFLNFLTGLSSDHGITPQQALSEAPAVQSSAAAFGHLAMAVPSSNIVVGIKRRVTPDTSPFSPNFRVADNIPQLPTASDWDIVSKRFETLQPVLTGARRIHCTLNVTIELLRRSLAKA